MISIVQLEYIIAVDTYRHFQTAADNCFVTQPTLSMQIKKLEEELGIVIFDRTRQPVIPTDIGEKILQQARKVVSESKKIEEIIKSHKGEVSGELRVGIIPTLSPYLLPRFLGSFLSRYPSVNLSIKELLTGEITEALKKDQIDAGLLVTPLNDEGILEEPLFYEEFLAYTSPELSKKKKLKIKDLGGNKFWLLAEGHCFRSQTLNLCGKDQIKNPSVFSFESGSLETLKRLVDTEGGITLLPELAVEDLSVAEKKRTKTFGENPGFREVSLVFSRNFVKQRLLKILTEEIKQAVPKHMLKPEGQIVKLK